MSHTEEDDVQLREDAVAAHMRTLPDTLEELHAEEEYALGEVEAARSERAYREHRTTQAVTSRSRKYHERLSQAAFIALLEARERLEAVRRKKALLSGAEADDPDCE